MQLQVEKYITLPQSTNNTPSCAAVFFDLTNKFNSVSRQAFCNVIAKSFPEILRLTTLFYEHAGTVHHKWADGTWRTLLMDLVVHSDLNSGSCRSSFSGIPDIPEIPRNTRRN